MPVNILIDLTVTHPISLSTHPIINQTFPEGLVGAKRCFLTQRGWKGKAQPTHTRSVHIPQIL